MKIAISSSMKNREDIRKTLIDFEKNGIEGIFPNLDYTAASGDVIDSVEESLFLANEHYKAIDESDIIYFIIKDGYIGTSCKLELGYAIAKDKQIYFSEPTDDIGLDCYVQEFVPLDEVDRFLKIKK